MYFELEYILLDLNAAFMMYLSCILLPSWTYFNSIHCLFSTSFIFRFFKTVFLKIESYQEHKKYTQFHCQKIQWSHKYIYYIVETFNTSLYNQKTFNFSSKMIGIASSLYLAARIDGSAVNTCKKIEADVILWCLSFCVIMLTGPIFTYCKVSTYLT